MTNNIYKDIIYNITKLLVGWSVVRNGPTTVDNIINAYYSTFGIYDYTIIYTHIQYMVREGKLVKEGLNHYLQQEA